MPKEIEFAQLADYPLVLPGSSNGLRVIVDAVARKLKVSLKIVADADSIVAQKEAAAHCGCIMIKAPQTVAGFEESQQCSSSIICRPHINRHLVLVTGHQRPHSHAARDVAGRVTEILRGLAS